MSPAVWTVGHSTCPLDEFIALLAHYRIEAIADVRRFPESLRLQHFGAAFRGYAAPAQLVKGLLTYAYSPHE